MRQARKLTKPRLLPPFDFCKLVKYGVDTSYVDHRGQMLLAERQRVRLNRIVSFARAYSPYYRDLYAGLNQVVDHTLDLPITRKRDLMDTCPVSHGNR